MCLLQNPVSTCIYIKIINLLTFVKYAIMVCSIEAYLKLKFLRNPVIIP